MGNVFTAEIKESVSYSSLVFSGTAPVVEKNGSINKSFVAELEKVLRERGNDSQNEIEKRLDLKSQPEKNPISIQPRVDESRPKSFSILDELKNHPIFKNQTQNTESNQTIVVCTENDSDMMDFFIIELPNQEQESKEKKEKESNPLSVQFVAPTNHSFHLSTHICSFDRSTLKMVQRSEKPQFRSDLEKALFEKFKSLNAQ